MSWKELPVKLKAYIVILSILSVPIILWAGRDLSTTHYESSWYVLAVLAIFTVPLFVFLESANITISIGDAYIIAIAMMHGVARALPQHFFHTLLISIFARRPKVYITELSLMLPVPPVLPALQFSLPQINRKEYSRIRYYRPCAVVLLATNFAANSILVSLAVCWSTNESIGKFWSKTCMPWAYELSLSAVACQTGIVVFGANTTNWLP